MVRLRNIEVPDNEVNTLMRVNMNGKNQISLDISQIDSETKDEIISDFEK